MSTYNFETINSYNPFSILPIENVKKKKKHSSKRKKITECQTFIFSPDDKIKQIGNGASSIVYKYSYPNDKNKISPIQELAIKQFNKFPNDTILGYNADEYSQQEELYFLFDIQDVPHTPRVLNSYSQSPIYYIITPYYGLPLYTLSGKLSLQTLQKITRQLLETLIVLKEKQIIHGDIKPENICFDGKEVCLIDFGIALRTNDFNNRLLIGTRYYRAPEVILGHPHYTTSIDIWALGCTLYELYTGAILFEIKEEDILLHLEKIITKLGPPKASYYEKGKLKGFDKYISYLNNLKKTIELNNSFEAKESEDPIKSKELLDLILQMVKFEDRISPEDALNHPFLQ